jgi:hypothetical protein
MKYALLIYEARGSLEALPKEQYEAMFAEYNTAPTNRSSSTAPGCSRWRRPRSCGSAIARR